MPSKKSAAATNSTRLHFVVVSDAKPIRKGRIPDQARSLASRLFDKGRSLRSIAAELSRHGYNGSSGKPYGAQSIKAMLSVLDRYDSHWFVLINHNIKVGPFQTKAEATAIIPLLREARNAAMADDLSVVSDLKLAEIIKQLAAAGLSQKQIAAVLVRLESWVCFTNKLNYIPNYLRKYLWSGVVTKTTLLKAVDAFGKKPTNDAILAIKRKQDGDDYITEQALFDYFSVIEQ